MKRLYASLLFIFYMLATMAWHGDVTVSTPASKMVLTAEEGGTLYIIYYGTGMATSADSLKKDSKRKPQPALPTFGTDDLQQPIALQVAHSDGCQNTELHVEAYENIVNERHTTHIFTLKDNVHDFQIRLFYKAYSHVDMIETWTEIVHHEPSAVSLNRFDSAVVPVFSDEAWLTHFHGEWAYEARMVQERLTDGIKTIANTDGSRNAQTSMPSLMLTLGQSPAENSGTTIGVSLCWSGNYELRTASVAGERHLLMAGICPQASHYMLDADTTFATPHLAMTVSESGMGGVSRNFHRWAREEGMLHRGVKYGDLLLNSWEGVYFDITEKRITDMIDDIADMGGELFVMDDGWFGSKYQRDNESALGDWTVDVRKLPGGIRALTKAARKRKIKFGIWIEPEAVNTKSCLYEQHPDWVLKKKGHRQTMGRGGTQLLLDLTNPDVQAFVVDMVTRLLTENPEIAYIKWDANVPMNNYGSDYLPLSRQQNIYVDYHKGLEKVLRSIRERFPDVVIQDCASGGGRANYGLLPFFDEYWLSDNNDALQRLKIQYGASMFFPANAMATHIGSSPDHTTGRRIPVKFRCDVAMNGRMGLELQPKHMSSDERRQVMTAIADYKQMRQTIQCGEMYRLKSPYSEDGFCATQYVGNGECVLLVYKTDNADEGLTARLRLQALQPDGLYVFEEKNIENGKPACSIDGKTYSGEMLMDTGLQIPMNGDFASRVFLLKRL